MLDRHSEIIAHFIGQFGQAAEQSLFRLHYDAFRAAERPEDAPGTLVDVQVNVRSDLAPDTYLARGVRWSDEDAPAPREILPLELMLRAAGPALEVPPADLLETRGELEVAVDATGFSYSFGYDIAYTTPIFDIAPPGGMVVVVYHQNILQDNDILLTRPLELSPELAASRSGAALDEALMGLARTADALTPGGFTLGRTDPDTATRIETLREAFAAVDPEDAPAGAEVTLVSAGDGTLPASGLLFDGAAVDTAPDLLEDELAERGHGTDAAADGDGEGTDGDATQTGVIEATLVIGPDATGPYQEAFQLIEAGGNLLMNEAVSGLAPVDAGLIAVGGQALSLTIISQVNLLSDRDTVIGPTHAPAARADAGPPRGPDGSGHGPAQAGPAEGKAASEGHNFASVHWESAVLRGPDGDSGPLGFAITEIEGNLVLTTHVIQLNLVTDNDVITFETTFHRVEIGTGENTAVNVLSELGFQIGFDMILVAGDMLNLVSLSQLNLAFDNDLVVDTDGVGGTVETAGNFLWNQAEVTWHGIDSFTDEMSGSAAEALETMAAGRLDIETLKHEPLLEGKEVPLLLTIGGNLVFDYRLEQINILADADTVQLFADAARANGFSPVDVDTGNNLLANVASLDIYGQDSTVMASGGVFSDVVIHQAGMYDTDDTPLDGSAAGSGLASEAVAFLADGMIDTIDEGPPGGSGVILDAGGGSGTFDTLGGVVA